MKQRGLLWSLMGTDTAELGFLPGLVGQVELRLELPMTACHGSFFPLSCCSAVCECCSRLDTPSGISQSTYTCGASLFRAPKSAPGQPQRLWRRLRAPQGPWRQPLHRASVRPGREPQVQVNISPRQYTRLLKRAELDTHRCARYSVVVFFSMWSIIESFPGVP